MPAAIPIVAMAVASGVAESMTLGVFASALVVGLSGMAGSLLAGAMTKKKGGGYDLTAQMRDRTATIRSAVAPRKKIYGEAMVSGPIVFVTSTGPDHKYAHVVVPLAGHECESIGEVWFDDKPSSAYDASKFRLKRHLGGPSQVADADLVAECPEIFNSFVGAGVTYIYIRFEYDNNAWPTGLPRTIKAIVKGSKVYDPRTGLKAWSDNLALCVRDYITGDIGLGAAGSEIDDNDFISGANISDESVGTPSGSSQARYTVNGVIDSSVPVADNLDSLCAAGAGHWAYVGGKIRIFPGVYTPAVGTLTDDDLRAPIKIRPRTPRQELFNSVRGVYSAPENLYQPTDFPQLLSSGYQNQDGGELIPKDIELPFVDDPSRAQRIARILLEQARQPITVEFPAKWAALNYSVGDTLLVTLQAGRTPNIWQDKDFKIVSWKLVEDGGGIDLTLREESSASYAWNGWDGSVVDPAPDSNLVNATTCLPPQNLTVTEGMYVTRSSGGVKTKAMVTWDVPTDAFVLGYNVQYKLQSDTNYSSLPETIETRAEILDLAPGVYDIKVTARNTLVTSISALVSASITGLSAPPADITGLSINAINNQAHITWDQSTDLDVRIGGHIRVKQSPMESGASYANSNDISPSIPGEASSVVLPLLAGTYFVKAVDSTGNESVNATSIVTDVPNIVTMNTVVVSAQDPQFTGAKTNMQVSGTTLEFAPGATYGVYEFDIPVDLGEVFTCRVTPLFELASTLVGDLIDARTSLIDSWSIFDGTQFQDVYAQMFISTTNDDPASGLASWSSWKQFTIGDYTARGFRFKMECYSGDQTHQIVVSTLQMIVDMPDRTKGGTVTTAAAGTAVSYPTNFHSKPALAVMPVGVSPGDYVDVVNETNSGFTVTVKNGVVGKAGTINYIAKGY